MVDISQQAGIAWRIDRESDSSIESHLVSASVLSSRQVSANVARERRQDSVEQIVSTEQTLGETSNLGQFVSIVSWHQIQNVLNDGPNIETASRRQQGIGRDSSNPRRISGGD